jgi:carbon monoxide dehydrogenase subunit G
MKLERSVSIARPPAEVLDYVADIRNDPSWHTDVLEAQASTEVVAVGTVFDVKLKPSMGVSGGTMTVSRLEPGHLVEFRGRIGRMAPVVTNAVEADDQGSRVTRSIEMEPPGIMRLMTPMIKARIGKLNEGFLANLKRVLEARPT